MGHLTLVCRSKTKIHEENICLYNAKTSIIRSPSSNYNFLKHSTCKQRRYEIMIQRVFLNIAIEAKTYSQSTCCFFPDEAIFKTSVTGGWRNCMSLCALHFALDRFAWDLPPGHQDQGPLYKTLRNLLTKSGAKRRLETGMCLGYSVTLHRPQIVVKEVGGAEYVHSELNANIILLNLT